MESARFVICRSWVRGTLASKSGELPRAERSGSRENVSCAGLEGQRRKPHAPNFGNRGARGRPSDDAFGSLLPDHMSDQGRDPQTQMDRGRKRPALSWREARAEWTKAHRDQSRSSSSRPCRFRIWFPLRPSRRKQIFLQRKPSLELVPRYQRCPTEVNNLRLKSWACE